MYTFTPNLAVHNFSVSLIPYGNHGKLCGGILFIYLFWIFISND